MRYGFKYKRLNTVTSRLRKALIFIVLSFSAITIGMTGGNILSQTDMKVIEKIDAQNFKMTLNSSYPLIDTVYNSGRVRTSITEEIKKIVKSIFGFDMDTPSTILNSQSAVMENYYTGDYQKALLKEDTSYKLDYSQVNEDFPQITEQLPTDASSISTEEGNEENDNGQGEIIKNSKIEIVNQTNFKIDIDSLLNSKLNINFNRKGPKVLIFHTHTTESYVSKLSQRYDPKLSCYNLDSRFNVVRVGEELKSYLEGYGIDTIHNGTIHNYPDSNKSYGNSQVTVSKILKSYPSIKIVIDIHRDGLEADKPKLRVVSKVNGKTAAQVMFVMGSDKPSLRHPNWQENLKLAIKIQEKLNEDCPGLARPILISKNRYNQNLSTGALLIEIGGDGNLLDECLLSTKYVAKAIDEVLNSLEK